MVLNSTTDLTTKNSATEPERRLETTVSRLEARLEIERAERQRLELEIEQQSQGDDLRILDTDDVHNIYVFEDDDVTGAAFDKFFTAPDPGLDKIRSFLLD